MQFSSHTSLEAGYRGVGEEDIFNYLVEITGLMNVFAQILHTKSMLMRAHIKTLLGL